MSYSNARILIICGVLSLFLVLALVLILGGDGEGRRYYAELVAYDPVDESSVSIGREWLVFNAGKVLHRFNGVGSNTHMEQIKGTVALRLGNSYKIVIEEIKMTGLHGNGEGLGESLGVFEGEHVAAHRFDINGAVICMVLAEAELMRCMSKRQ